MVKQNVSIYCLLKICSLIVKGRQTSVGKLMKAYENQTETSFLRKCRRIINGMSFSLKGIILILFCVQAPFDMVLWKNIPLEYVSENCSVVSNSLQPTPWTVVHRILQARILEWVAVPFSRGSSNPAVEPRSPENIILFFSVSLILKSWPGSWIAMFGIH